MVAVTVETTEGLKSGNDNLSKPQEVMVVGIAEKPEVKQDDKEKMDYEIKNEELYEETVVELMKVVFPKTEEELVDFLNTCKLGNSRSMLCPNCSIVYDENVAKKIEALKKKGPQEKNPKVVFNHAKGAYNVQVPQGKHVFPYQRTFVPPTDVPNNNWVRPF